MEHTCRAVVIQQGHASSSMLHGQPYLTPFSSLLFACVQVEGKLSLSQSSTVPGALDDPTVVLCPAATKVICGNQTKRVHAIAGGSLRLS
jgi:hypothetical protein